MDLFLFVELFVFAKPFKWPPIVSNKTYSLVELCQCWTEPDDIILGRVNIGVMNGWNPKQSPFIHGSNSTITPKCEP